MVLEIRFLSKKPTIRPENPELCGSYIMKVPLHEQLRHGQAEQCWAAMLFFPFNGLCQPSIAKTAERK